MLRLIFFVVLAGALVIALTRDVSAGIKIPCTGDRLVKVLDVPADKQPQGREIHLGYKFPGCFSEGEWIGYTGKSDSYVHLDNATRDWMLNALGRSDFPPVPSRFSYPVEALLVEILTVGALGLVLLWELFSRLFRRRKMEEA
ncbi:MAG: hypothetical protein AAF732_04675 [Pseudomonadota bacterium]